MEKLTKKMEKLASSRNVSAVPSGTNSLTFYMEEEEEEFTEEDLEYDPSTTSSSQMIESSQTGEAPEVLLRNRELTDKYLAGQLSFKEFVSEMKNLEEEAEDEEDPSTGAEDSEQEADWEPPGKKAKPPSTPKSTTSKQAKSVKESLESFEEELEQSRKPQRKRFRGVRGRRIDPALKGLMGEANLRFARGDVENAEKMCLEIIRQDPTVAEPFQTLATIYEEAEEIEKSLQFALIAAHLAPPDPEEWSRLADISLEHGDVPQACICYKKAIIADPTNARFHFTRASLLEQLGEKQAALRAYKRALRDLSRQQGEEFLQATKEAARLLHERDLRPLARPLFHAAFERHPDIITAEDVNLFLDLLLVLEEYQEALEICCRHCGVKFSSEKDVEELAKLDPENQLATFTELIVPDELEADIRCKLLVILVNLKLEHLARDLIDLFLEADPEEFGDFLLDISEALMKNSRFEAALPFLARLVGSVNYGVAGVWLQYAECLQSANKLEEAEDAFSRVIELAPHHYNARLQLSVVMRALGRPEDALLALAQDETEEMLNPRLMFERCQLLLQENKLEELVNKARLLFSRHFVNIRNKDELHAVTSAKRLSVKNKALSEVRIFRREPLLETEGPEFESASDNDVKVHEEFELFKKVCEILFESGRYDELQRLACSALGSPVFAKNEPIEKECEFLVLLSSYFNGDLFHAYNSARQLVIKNMSNAAVWNLFNLVIMRADDLRHNRFLMRLMSRHPDNLALGILNGHNCLVAGTYKYSLGEYMSAFKQDSSNPLVAMMLGLTFCHMACQKFSAKKHSLVIQSCAFLNKYKELRGDCQEVCYNLGRAMHQLNLLPAALFYYKQGLELGPSVAQEGEGDNIFDLRREIAFNISLIYQNSGNIDLARYYTDKYIVV